MKIRNANENDYEGLMALFSCLGFTAEAQSMKDRIKATLCLDYHKIIVAEVSGQLVSFVHFFEAPSLLTERTVEIGGLAVLKAYRRKKIGKRLMRSVEDWAAKRGCNSILLATHEDRSDAVKFYESLGYDKEFKTFFMRKSL